MLSFQISKVLLYLNSNFFVIVIKMNQIFIINNKLKSVSPLIISKLLSGAKILILLI